MSKKHRFLESNIGERQNKAQMNQKWQLSPSKDA